MYSKNLHIIVLLSKSVLPAGARLTHLGTYYAGDYEKAEMFEQSKQLYGRNVYTLLLGITVE